MRAFTRNMLYRDVYGSRGPGRSNPTYRVRAQHDRLDSPRQTSSKNSGIVGFSLADFGGEQPLKKYRMALSRKRKPTQGFRIYLLSLANVANVFSLQHLLQRIHFCHPSTFVYFFEEAVESVVLLAE